VAIRSQRKSWAKEKTQVPKKEQEPEEEQMHTTDETSIIEPSPSDTNCNKSSKEDFPVVGIGASDGGLAVNPNCVYVIPPNRDMIYKGRALHLLEPGEPRGHNMPIDSFFRTLAEEKKEQAIGIVLSGTGSDGTLGIRAIKAEGGMAMAQTLESSDYDSMPQSVISTGLSDYILPSEEMPAQLISYVTQAFGKTTHPAGAEDSMKKIFSLVLTQTGHDFSNYKKGTIIRRIERRMTIHNIKGMDEYVHY
jgi:two-component system, chemotaxis family, CheB/CheR fusion protein